jgi:beta-galactosidase
MSNRSFRLLIVPSLAAASAFLAPAPAFAAATPPRERLSLDAGWRFAKADGPAAGAGLAYADLKPWLLPARNDFLAAAERTLRPPGEFPAAPAQAAPGFDDSQWRQLNLPHDWGIEGPFHPEYSGDTARLPYWGVAWYRRHLELPAADQGRRLVLAVDGAMSYASVWLNGRLVGGWPYGYASFALDLTDFARPGADNVLAIRLDNPPESSRWYPGGGLYRHLWLVKTAPVHIAHWGTAVTTPEVTADQATVDLKVTLANDGADQADVTLRSEIYALGADGRREGGPVDASGPAAVRLGGRASAELEQAIAVEHPRLWSTRAPQRYVAVTTVTQDGAAVDQSETPFGIRSIAFDPGRGFLLNGEVLRIQGVCDHHDLGALGSALNERALERQLQELQEMGCNAIRTSHNPPAPELLDLCDRMGLVVMDEAFDCWMLPKRPNDYHLLFADWHVADLRAQIRRDRNHPCVILWSIGNEIPEQKNADGVRIGGELQRLAHAEDPTRPVTSACNNADAGFNGFAGIVDVFGVNYRSQLYAPLHAARPHQTIFGSETESEVSSRGVYVFPLVEDKLQGRTADFQVSSYDYYAPPWAWPPDREFAAEDRDPYVAGEFVWTGWDYLGEPTPFGTKNDPARSSYFGIIDLAGFKKDRFYLYQAHWRPDLPMAHLVPHWTWPERVGQVTPVQVYTSGDAAELFLNGRSLGRKAKAPFTYRLRWDDVVYEPGELKVVAYKGGRPWAEDVQRTAGAPARLELRADRPVLAADGRDLVFVTVAVTDAAGTLVPRAHDHLGFAVSGPGDLIAVDDGDATSFEPFQGREHDAFNGLALAIVRTRAGQTGTITVAASAAGLNAGRTTVRSAEAGP